MNEKRMITMLEKRKISIGKERDKLREFISDYEELAEHCDQAYDAIQSAIYSLSQLT